jgi:hypothetical protein
MSAPVNIEKLCQYFGTSNIFEAKRQANAVQIKHVDSPPVQYDIAVVATVRHIVMTKPKGNILVFMTSPREIEKTCVELRTQFPGLKVLPIYSSLPKHAQDLATSGSTTQMCIVSTDVAEASLTIPGVIYVVGMLYAVRNTYCSSCWLTVYSRLWTPQRGGLQPSSRNDYGIDSSYLASLCPTASRMCWTNRTWGVLPSLQQGISRPRNVSSYPTCYSLERVIG